MTYRVSDADGEILESGIVDTDAVRAILLNGPTGAYAEDPAGNRVADDCRNCGAGDVGPGEDCPECLGCNI